MKWLRAIKTLVWKDLVQEWRSRDLLTAMFSFAILSLFIFNYAMELAPANRSEIAAGLVWVLILFSGTLGLNRSFSAEQDQGCFDALSLAVPDLSLIYLAKMVSNFLMMLFIIILILPLYSLFYNQSLFNPAFIGSLLLGAWGYAAAGTLIAGMTVQTRMRDLLLPVLLFPLLMPLNMAVVKAAGGFLSGMPYSQFGMWIPLLLVYNLIISTVGWMVFAYVISE
ncbi:MAG: heme exporter protein CcmB [Anaerolineaceae bacterium]|nr:heme exporter protein CcmB [Anaerolineaceae bacterium]